jgi:hypothetical protein
MSESDRVGAIEAYQFYARYYALLGLRQQVRAAVADGRGEIDDLLANPDTHEEWEYQSRILVQEFGVEDIGAGLTLLASVARQVAEDCERTREKDDTRGVRIIDDYAEVHPPADRDRIVRQAREEADRLREEAEEYLRRFPARSGNGTPASADQPHAKLQVL